MSSLINNSVNLGGNQTITGNKTFEKQIFTTANARIMTQQTNSGYGYGTLEIYRAGDSNNARAGVYVFDNSSNTSAAALLNYNNGNPYFQIPNSAALGSAISTAAINHTGNGYLKFGNGIQLVWGSGDTNKTTTFSRAFSEIFAIVCNNVENGNYGNAAYIGTYSNTNVFMRKYNNATVSARYIAIGRGA